MIRLGLTATFVTLLSTHPSFADIARGDLEITDIYTDLDIWLGVVQTATQVDFVGFPHGTQIDDEYAESGLFFVDGFYTAYTNDGLFADDFGLDGNAEVVVVEFNEVQNSIGTLFPGGLRYVLYNDGELVGWTQDQGGGGTGFFAGVVMTAPFDEVWLIDDGSQVTIDNLYFSFVDIPAPAAALPLLALAGMAGRTRRRCV